LLRLKGPGDAGLHIARRKRGHRATAIEERLDSIDLIHKTQFKLKGLIRRRVVWRQAHLIAADASDLNDPVPRPLDLTIRRNRSNELADPRIGAPATRLADAATRLALAGQIVERKPLPVHVSLHGKAQLALSVSHQQRVFPRVVDSERHGRRGGRSASTAGSCQSNDDEWQKNAHL
jgi:hypothetical protein